MNKRVGFLCGAPRVSTHPDAEVSGSRARLVGMLKSFEAMGWDIKPFILGDRIAQKYSGKGSEKIVSSSFFRTLAIDLARLNLGLVNTFKSWRELNNKVDWVYEYAATLQSLGWIFKLQGIPWILQTEAPLFYEAKVERNALVLSSLAKWMEIKAYQDCDVLVCVSETLKEIIVKELGISPDKMVVVPNGVDTDFFNIKHYQPKRLFPGFTIGFTGSLYSWTGIDLLLDVLGELRAEGLDLSLTIVGDGLMRKDLEARVKRLGISDNVAFVGRITWQDVPQYIAGFDLGFSGQVQLQMGQMYLSPVKIYEYMSMRKPVIASAFQEAKQIVREGKTGFLFQPGDKKDLKRALIDAFEARNRLDEMGNFARQEIEFNHSWKSRAHILIEGIEQNIGKSKDNERN
jgi:glycosyltransferase involved in cell wall biosynthesis